VRPMEPERLGKELLIHRLADRIRTTSGPAGGTVLDIAGNRIFRLNEMGDLILHCVQQGWGETRIATHVSHQYSVNQDLAKRDVHEFLNVLNEYRLLDMAKRSGER